MLIQYTLLALLPLASSVLGNLPNPIGPNPNNKRGLVYVPDAKSPHPEDDKLWIQSGSPLTWYYNYKDSPDTELEGGPTKLEFIPMLWGDGSNAPTFVSTVEGLIQKGYNISYVLGFNEPDNPQQSNTGGSGMTVERAVELWKANIEPLAKKGIKLGSPAPTGSPDGLVWMQSFFKQCTNCTIDFIPLHWYGNMDGLYSHFGQYSAAFPNKTFWFTEFALADASVADSQSYFNTSLDYFDRIPNIGRYTYFGSFRSSVSNVGKNAAMLDRKGGLTYLGAWYLNENQNKAQQVTGDLASAGSAMFEVRWAVTLTAGLLAITGGLLL